MAAPTPPFVSGPILEPADVSLGLRYLPSYDVIVVTDDVAAEVIPVAAEAAEFASAHLVVLVGEGSAPPEGLPADALVLQAPAEILTVRSRPWSARTPPRSPRASHRRTRSPRLAAPLGSVLSPEGTRHDDRAIFVRYSARVEGYRTAVHSLGTRGMPSLLILKRRRSSERGQSIVEFALVLPLLVFLMVGIIDLARIYTTMLSVESAAREAADYGSFGAQKWNPLTFNLPPDGVTAKMEQRACTAASNLTDFAGSTDTCTNPGFSYQVSPDRGGDMGPAQRCVELQ